MKITNTSCPYHKGLNTQVVFIDVKLFG
jgi:hypothetical protein